jgi:UDP-glucose 4-epimerase
MDVNIRGTVNVLQACRHAGIKRLVYTSSAAVYGDAKYLPIDEVHPLAPESPYAASKLAGEKYCFAYRKAFGTPATAVRCFNVYGPRQGKGAYANAIAIFLEKVSKAEAITVYGDGEQTRDLVFVEDVVDGMLLAAASPEAPGNVFNLASGKATSVNQLVKIIAEVTGRKAAVNHAAAKAGEIIHSQASIAKATKVLGFHPTTDLETGIGMTWQAMKRD